MVTVPQNSGHTLYSAHIEEPEKEFFVAFDAPAYVNVLCFVAGRRWARVLDETGEALSGGTEPPLYRKQIRAAARQTE